MIWTNKPPESSSKIFHPDDLYDGPPGSPSISHSPTRLMPNERVWFSGEDVISKIKKVREKLVNEGLWGMVIAALDEVAWLLNLRASDIPYNPVSKSQWTDDEVFFAYVIITPDDLVLYTRHVDTQMTDDLLEYLTRNSVILRPYDQFWPDLSSHAKHLKTLRDQHQKDEEDVEMNGSNTQRDGSPELKKMRIEPPKIIKDKDKKKDMRYKFLVPKAASWAITESMGTVKHDYLAEE
jgi:hypothetical protein